MIKLSNIYYENIIKSIDKQIRYMEENAGCMSCFYQIDKLINKSIAELGSLSYENVEWLDKIKYRYYHDIDSETKKDTFELDTDTRKIHVIIAKALIIKNLLLNGVEIEKKKLTEWEYDFIHEYKVMNFDGFSKDAAFNILLQLREKENF